MILFIVLLIAWALGFVVFHLSSGLIHILLVVAVIAIILHFVRGRRHCEGKPSSSANQRSDIWEQLKKRGGVFIDRHLNAEYLPRAPFRDHWRRILI